MDCRSRCSNLTALGRVSPKSQKKRGVVIKGKQKTYTMKKGSKGTCNGDRNITGRVHKNSKKVASCERKGGRLWDAGNRDLVREE